MKSLGLVARFIGALLLILTAGVVGLLEVIALIDPVGTKMSDDGDPFGDPHVSWVVHAAWIGVTFGCLIAAGWLLSGFRRRDGP